MFKIVSRSKDHAALIGREILFDTALPTFAKNSGGGAHPSCLAIVLCFVWSEINANKSSAMFMVCHVGKGETESLDGNDHVSAWLSQRTMLDLVIVNVLKIRLAFQNMSFGWKWMNARIVLPSVMHPPGCGVRNVLSCFVPCALCIVHCDERLTVPRRVRHRISVLHRCAMLKNMWRNGMAGREGDEVWLALDQQPLLPPIMLSTLYCVSRWLVTVIIRIAISSEFKRSS